MRKKLLSFVLILSMLASVCPGAAVFAAATNDGTVYTDSWIPGTDEGKTGDGTKLSVKTVTDEDGSYYLYTSVNGKSDAPLIYRQLTTALTEMTFMLTDSGSRVCYLPVFYDKAKGSENWNPIINISENGGVVISNMADGAENNIFTAAEDGWDNGKYTLVSKVAMNKKHTIRVEHNPDKLSFTVRFDGHSVTLGENPDSAFVVSTKTGSADARNSKGPRFAFAASANQSFRVYDIYIRGTVAGNTNASKTATVFSEAREYTYEGQLKVVSTYPENGSYGIMSDEKDFTVNYSRPLSESFDEDFRITVSYTKDGESPTEVLPEEYSFDAEPENSLLKISMNEELKKGVTYTVKIENIYSDEGNPLYESSFSFATDDGTKEILDAVNSASSLRTLGQVLNEYKSDIGLKEDDYSDYNANRNVISWIFKNKPYSDVKDIKAMAENAEAMKSELDSCDEEDIGEFAEKYAEVLFDDMTAYEKYKSLPALYQTMANSMIVGKMPFATLIDFADGFEECVNSISFDTDSNEESGEKIICDFTLTGTDGWIPSKADYSFITESTPDFANGKTLGRYYVPETTTDQNRMDYILSFSDVTDCDTLYIWAYSPASSGNEYVFDAYCGNNDAGQWMDFRKVMKVDFVGWKLISIPLSSFSAVRSPSWSSLKEIRIAQAGLGVTEAIGGTEIYFAKMWFGSSAVSSKPEIISSNASDGATGFGAGDAAEFEFSDKVYFNPANPPYIADSEGNRVEADVWLEKNTLVIAPKEPLKENSQYTACLSGLADAGANPIASETHTFTTAAKGLYASIPQFSVSSLPDSGSVCAAVSLGNTSDVAYTAELVVAAYDKNGRLVSTSSKESRIEPGAKEETLLCYIDLDSYEGITLKAFTVNKDDNCKPVSKKPVIIRDSAASPDKVFESFEKEASFADGNLGINKIAVNIDTVTVESCISKNTADAVVVRVYDGENNLKYITQATTDANGCSSVEFNFDSNLDAGGKYTVEVSSLSMTNSSSAVGYFYYLDSASKAEISDEVNSASSEKKVASALNENKLLMSLPDIDYTASENMYISHVIFRDKPYASYSDMIAKYQRAVAALDAINESYWSAYADIIEDYADVIFDRESVYNDFKKLSDSKKNKVAQSVYDKRPFESFEEFAKELADAIDDLDSGSSSGGSGGGSGGSSSPKGGYTSSLPAASPVAPSDDKYVDLDSCLWAESYIYDLKAKGVLTMSADKRFRPDDSITREEFVKMLVVSLGISASGDVSFADVDKDAWYYSYVCTAYNAGIVNGMSAESFGVGELITREQMAAMACRALNITEFEKASDGIFADDAQISDYARDSVYHMQYKGIINGTGNGLFAPKANATRAQAAKIISMMSAL